MREARDEGRRARIFLALAGVVAGAVAALAGVGMVADRGAGAHREDQALVAGLRLTGLALWSEASYCRHPAEADLFAPHAYHPAAPDQHPAASIVPPHPGFSLSEDGGSGAEGAT